jgi:hypothetical protein
MWATDNEDDLFEDDEDDIELEQLVADDNS